MSNTEQLQAMDITFDDKYGPFMNGEIVEAVDGYIE